VSRLCIQGVRVFYSAQIEGEFFYVQPLSTILTVQGFGLLCNGWLVQAVNGKGSSTFRS
jgi:hypothetical protein